jgi:putative ABC transport system permease protein
MRRFVLRLLSLLRSDRAEAHLAREIESHLRLLEDHFMAQGMSATEARQAARRSFGGVEQVKERQRDARSFTVLSGVPLDFRLGARMLFKYPGLTFVGGAAIALGIAVGAVACEFFVQVARPVLPLDEGDRIVAVRNWDVAANREESRTAYDFARWREATSGLEELGAFRTVERNLIIGARDSEAIEVAEMTAAAFGLARVPALLGRPLVDADEAPGAHGVVVLGYDVWLRRFGGNRQIVGEVVRLGHEAATVVGVMPKGFAFPVAHSVWAPLRLDAAWQPREGPELRIIGRLRRGVTRQQAEAALTAAGQRMAAERPDTHASLRPEIRPYAQSILDLSEESLGAVAFTAFGLMFVILVCANVAALMFARAVTRENEILVRNALGASRGRIVVQLFVEALVLGGVAASIGLVAASVGVRWLFRVLEADAGRQLPFWLHASLSSTTILYAAVLTLLGAVISGVMPALKITRNVGPRLRQAAAGAEGLRFGAAWTTVIVTQVAVTVAFPAAAFFARQYVVGMRTLDPGFPAEHYLGARVAMEGDLAAESPPERVRAEAAARIARTYAELERRLEADPGVAGVTFVDYFPLTLHPRRGIELEGSAAAQFADDRVNRAVVARDFFDVLGARVLQGRQFREEDTAPGRRVVIVNETLVRRSMAALNPIGRRLRYVGRPGQESSPWYEIVGVVPDLGMVGEGLENAEGIYHPGSADTIRPHRIAVHVKGDATSFVPRLRAIATDVDPGLRLHEIVRLDEAAASRWLETQFLYRVLILVSSIGLLLSLTGIYSVTSLTVSRRTREIGIRLALGADARRIVTAIFSRALMQIATGIAAGGALVFALTRAVVGLSAREAAAVILYMMLVMAVCTLACVVPTRRAMRIEPTEALREG